jgi:hypothetical protein
MACGAERPAREETHGHTKSERHPDQLRKQTQFRELMIMAGCCCAVKAAGGQKYRLDAAFQPIQGAVRPNSNLRARNIHAGFQPFLAQNLHG